MRNTASPRRSPCPRSYCAPNLTVLPCHDLTVPRSNCATIPRPCPTTVSGLSCEAHTYPIVVAM